MPPNFIGVPIEQKLLTYRGDNAVAESFWASLKRECVKGRIFETRAAARQAIFVWINWYNTTRLHSSLDYKTPKTWEQEFPIAS